jgi:hypothetical protein
MRTLAEAEVVNAILEEYTRPQDPIHLYIVHGQAIFPIIMPSGALRTAVALYLIRKGTTDRIPLTSRSVMPDEGELVELPEGWAVASIVLRGDFTVGELRASLKKAERALLGKE